MSTQMIIGAVVVVALAVFILSKLSSQYTPAPYIQRPQGSGSGIWFVVAIIAVAVVAEWPWLMSNLPLNDHHIQVVFQTPTPTAVKGSRQYYINLARTDATAVGINPGLFVRQMDAESAWNPDAVSPKGAIGIAQFMPQTAKALGIDPRNPEQALKGAAHLMASYVKRYHGSYAMALAAYNAGSGMVAWAIQQAQKYGGTWDGYLPTETQHYIHLILGV